ncbi:DapH/DapD/GlmU-related protein [Marinilactibacillus sp. Marseille-P9653]|uniref:acyltransferase n=1 Tax=Marinilactibacillus sp. Marseille-P9653 TaxID=2866583 RepID=UPI001CE3FA8A|nr:acyltransferase [Marinilactibacillus sp. Marseille-P9653]
MKIESVVKKLLGKKEFSLSNEVPFSYIIHKGIFYLLGIIRGTFKFIGTNRSGKRVFLGKNVKILVKKKFSVGDFVRIEDNVSIDCLSIEGVHFGNRVKIGANSRIQCTGALSNLGKGLYIGNDTSFAENAFFGAAGGIEIGKDVIAGQNVRFHAENHLFNDVNELIRLQGVKREGIKIGNNVWIGAGVVFLDGSDVADGCVIAAGSVVTKKFENNTVIGGVPAKEIKKRL